MKKLSALLSLALGLCLIPAIHAADPKTTPKPATKTTSPAAAKADPKAVAKDAKTKPEAEQPVVGILIPRTDGSGGFLNLKIDGGWTITFLDKDKKEIEADLSRAIIRYRKHLKNNQFILTRSGDGKSLRSSSGVIRRPYIFPALPVILFKEGQEGVAESYVVQFRQPMPGDGEGVPIDEMTPEQLEKVPAPK